MHILCTKGKSTHTQRKRRDQGSCKAGPPRAEAAPHLSWGKPCDKLICAGKPERTRNWSAPGPCAHGAGGLPGNQDSSWRTLPQAFSLLWDLVFLHPFFLPESFLSLPFGLWVVQFLLLYLMPPAIADFCISLKFLRLQTSPFCFPPGQAQQLRPGHSPPSAPFYPLWLHWGLASESGR